MEEQNNNAINLTIDIDVDALVEAISKVKKLDDNDAVFKLLSQVRAPKKQLEDALELVEAAERKIKMAISDKARALYGNDWQAIAGTGYKIGRQFGGNLYEQVGDVDDKFVKVTTSIDSAMVDAYVKTNSKLPDGIGLNKNRQEQIRITLKG